MLVTRYVANTIFIQNNRPFANIRSSQIYCSANVKCCYFGEWKKVNVHFVYNKITRQFDDFKFK